MKKILLIATGGTIASKPTDAGLVPGITPEEIIEFVPEVRQVCEIESIQLCNRDSTNMRWVEWELIARKIQEEYPNYDGFVVTHGTDTMAYAAAALSYLVQNSTKPIVFTGSQKSIYLQDTDARNNLFHAFCYAAEDRACGVHLVFDGKVIVGTRARKTRTKSYDAFSSVDFPETAVIQGSHVLYFVEEYAAGNPVFYHTMDPSVFVLKLTPGMDASIFAYLGQHYRAVILESFGMGGLPDYLMDGFRALIDAGTLVIMATQVPHEGLDMTVYQVGKSIRDQYGVMQTGNMTMEAAVSKIMWAMGQSRDPETVRRLFETPIQKDLLV